MGAIAAGGVRVLNREIVGSLEIGPATMLIDPWPGAAVEDEVYLFGPGTRGESSVTTLAEAIGTVGEEIIVRVSPLVPRIYL